MVELLHVAERDVDLGHLVLDVVQTCEFLIQLGAREAVDQPLVDVRRSEYQR